jgi:monoamine oxidase
VVETDSVQHVRWNIGEHMYFNPGPARLPYHHQGILSYCRMLNVPLEVLCNDNRGALMQDDAAFGGAPQLNRAVVNDARGYVAELAAKALDKDLLDRPVGSGDKEKLRDFLKEFGALEKDFVYRGSTRSGYAVPPGGGDQAGSAPDALDLRQLLASDFWHGPMQFGEYSTMAATMLQPVGGMGRIGQAFGRKLFDVITYGAEVTQLRRTESGARVVWRDVAGAEQATEAAFVVVTIPFPVLRGIDADFAAPTRAAIAAVDYVPAGKVAFQAERRFWEEDHGIYGGISWTSRDITQIWYPTAGINQKKGVLVGAYIWDDDIGKKFAALPLSQRLENALADGEKLHPEYRQWLTKGVAVAWPKIPYSGAGWAEWSKDARAEHYPVLLKGDGPFLFCGEHMSHVTGWQEGAVLSAHHALRDVGERMRG